VLGVIVLLLLVAKHNAQHRSEEKYPLIHPFNTLSMQSFLYKGDFLLESGDILRNPTIGYTTYGKLNEDKSNVVWVCHALTGNSEVHDWWAGVFGEGRPLDPTQQYIICANAFGSCYGSTGPLNFSEGINRYFETFPLVTPKDMARAHELLCFHLGIEKIQLLIGASLGGQQALEWSIAQPERFERAVFIATNAKHSPYGIAFNEAQRLAIYADPSYLERKLNGGRKGLIAARAIGMLSYRSYEGYALTQSEETEELTQGFKAASYQNYQGEKLAKRFNAYSYVALSKSMDAHNVGRQQKSIAAALRRIKAQTLVIGVTSDQLFPTSEQRFLASHIKDAVYTEISSNFGHDGFLVEFEQLNEVLINF
jgi:homoserine O-acetyltransferase/O-succinyltransferase